MDQCNNENIEYFDKFDLSKATLYNFNRFLIQVPFNIESDPIEIGKVVKYFSYYFNNNSLINNFKTINNIFFIISENWDHLSTEINQEYWEPLIDGEYKPLSEPNKLYVDYITKENIEIIVDYAHSKRDAQGIALLLKYGGKILNDKKWSRSLWECWYNRHELKKANINQYWHYFHEEIDNNPSFYYQGNIKDRLDIINKDKLSNERKLTSLKNIINNIKQEEPKIKVELSAQDWVLIDLIQNCEDINCSKALKILLGDDLIYASPIIGYYYFNKKTALWEKLNESLLIHIANEKLIELSEKAINALTYNISLNENKKGTSENEMLLKKLNRSKHEFSKITFIEKILRSSRILFRDVNFEKKLNKISYLLPIEHHSVINLTNSVIEPRTKEHYFTFECNVSYGNKPDHDGNVIDHIEEVQNFFLDLACGDKELCKLYQTFLGLCLTGEIVKLIFILHGIGNNGKSCMISILNAILGQFCTALNDNIFVKSNSNAAHSSYLTGVINTRAGISSELDDNAHFNIPLLNKLVGSDKTEFRACGSDVVEEFKSFCKLILLTNDIPKYPPSKKAFIARFCPIQFPTQFVNKSITHKKLKPHQRDQNTELAEKMQNSPEYLNDILRWMVEGSVRFYQDGKVLLLPESVQQFKNKCVLSNDDLLQFLNDNIQASDKSFVKVLDLYVRKIEGTPEYNQYWTTNKVNPGRIKKFCQDLRDREFKLLLMDRSQHIVNYRLLSTPEEEYEKENQEKLKLKLEEKHKEGEKSRQRIIDDIINKNS